MTYLCILFSLYKPQIQAFKFVDTDVNLDKTFRFTRWFLFFPLFDTKHTWNVFPLCHSNGLLVCTPLFLFYSTNYLFIHKLRERIKFETFQCFNGVVLSSVMFSNFISNPNSLYSTWEDFVTVSFSPRCLRTWTFIEQGLTIPLSSNEFEENSHWTETEKL